MSPKILRRPLTTGGGGYTSTGSQSSGSQSGGTLANGTPAGVNLIASGSPLTRLNYFDGKFLRAADMLAEQQYFQTLVALSNQAGGPGVAYGYSVTLNSNSQFELTPGLAIDPKGRLLLLTASQAVNLSDLIALSTTAPASSSSSSNSSSSSAVFSDCMQALSGTTLIQPATVYLLVICHAETLCGQEDVYGKLCQEACVTSTDRPYAVEGIVVRLTPLTLQTQLPVSSAMALGPIHQRSRVASAYYHDERGVIADLISKGGLESEIWCMGADGASGCCVPLGVVGVAGSSVSFFDAWTARRERMDPPAKRYWQWRMRMRPWDVFLAQILQFQCQLRDGLQTTPSGTTDPCSGTRSLVGEAASVLAAVQKYYQAASSELASSSSLRLLNTVSTAPTFAVPGGLQYLSDLTTRLSQAQNLQLYQILNRLLIRQGIIELPSAGYLPVTPGTAMTINQQVLQWMGEGVNLRFCVVTPDYVQHALEEAQHMERISLLAGLDNPNAKPNLDILVPNGQILLQQPSTANLFAAQIEFQAETLLRYLVEHKIEVPSAASSGGVITVKGSARAASLDSGGGAFYLAGEMGAASSSSSSATNRTTSFSNAEFLATGAVLESISVAGPPQSQLWASLQCDQDVFKMSTGQTTPVSLRIVLGLGSIRETALDFRIAGATFRLDLQETLATGARIAEGRISGVASLQFQTANGPGQQMAGAIDLTAAIEITQNASGRLVVVEIIDAEKTFEFVFRAQWVSTDPLELKLTLQEAAKQTAISINATGDLLASPDVVKSTNSFHIAAVDAIGRLAAALNDSGFSLEALRNLFPPAPPGGGADVIGTLPWVLFQRRREKQCGPSETAAVATRKYRLYLYNASLTSVAIDRLAVTTSAPSAVEVGVVEFAADSTTLLTSTSTLVAEWNKVPKANQITRGFIYSMGDAASDGDTLALGRLNALELALSVTTAISPAVDNRIIPSPPAFVDTAAVDGVILLITQTAASSSSSSARSVTGGPVFVRTGNPT